MHPSEYCKQIGLKSLQHLADISKQPIATLQRWWVRKNHQFKIMAAGSLVTEKSSHKDPSMVRGMVVMKTKDYHEDYGQCLFFHFHNFEESPTVHVGSPYSSDFEDDGKGNWTHFVKDFDFNFLMDEAQRLNRGRK